MPNENAARVVNSPPFNLHVAIIMDGSGRWAESRGLARVEGHHAGRAAVCRAVEAALAAGVRVLTLFTFSTENWGRPEGEVAELMRIFGDFLREDVPYFVLHGVCVTVIGRRDRLPASLREAIDTVEAASEGGGQMRLRLAIDYSGRDAILHAASRFHQEGEYSYENFGRILAQAQFDAEPVPDIDLLIRTGGEQRLSNCPLWEIAYAELYFTPCMWPDFDSADFAAALQEFSTRQRRFGRIPLVTS